MRKSILLRIFVFALSLSLVAGMMPANIALAETTLPAVPDNLIQVLNDDCSSQSAAGWIRQGDPVNGNYITDYANTLGNPGNAEMMQPPEGEYIFYGSELSKDVVSYISYPVDIGKGAWLMEFDARILDLMTPSANTVWRGVSFDISANNKRFKITLNSKDADGNIKISVLKGSGSDEKIIAFPDNQKHNWRIAFDGTSTLSVILDGIEVAAFPGINNANNSGDGILIYNVTYNYSSGITEVYFDNLKFYKSEQLPDVPTVDQVVIDDDCSNLYSAGWSCPNPVGGSKPEDPANYITDYTNSLGNPDNVLMKQVPEGQYLFYSSQNSIYSTASNLIDIGAGPWYAEFDASIVDLMTPSANSVYRGISFEVFGAGKRYKITFNSKDQSGNMKIVAMNATGAEEKVVPLPDANMHKWKIGFDGGSTLTVSMDGAEVASFKGISVQDGTSDRVIIYNATHNLLSGTNEFYLDSFKLVKKVAAPVDPAAIKDDCSSLNSSNWVRSNDPREGNYITDNANTLGNPGEIEMKTAPEGQYLFYSNTDAIYSALTNNVEIGEGPWYTEFDANIVDLMTPSPAAPHWRGISFDFYANGKKVKVTFNSKDQDGNFKVYVFNNSEAGYEAKTVSLPKDGGIHRWGISYDGTANVKIALDGAVVAAFSGVSISDTSDDKVIIYNSTYNLVSGTNEFYMDNFSLMRNSTPVWPEVVLYDDCSNIAAAGWTATVPKQGVYVSDHSSSLGNPDNISMLEVPEGQYLFYGDNTAAPKTFTKMVKNISIGSGAWTMQFNARFDGLATPDWNNIYRSLSFEIFAGRKEYKITFNDQNKILSMIDSSSGAYNQVQVDMPSDGNFHKWELVYDGKGKLFIGIDDNLVARFDNPSVVTTQEDAVKIWNDTIDNYQSGITQVYMDEMKLTTNYVPAWSLYDPRLGGISVLPESSSASVDVVANVKNVNPDWFGKSDVVVIGSLYKGDELLSSANQSVSGEAIKLNLNPKGNSGILKLVLQFMNGTRKIDEVTRDVDIVPSILQVTPGQKLVAKAGETYIFTRVNEMTEVNEVKPHDAGWKVSMFKYKGSDETGYVLESKNGSQTLELPMELQGWFGVYVGYATGTQELTVSYGSNQSVVQFEGGRIKPGEEYGEQLIGEKFITAADFNSSTFSITPTNYKPARIAYIKLKALTDSEIAEYTTPDEGELGKRAVYNNDGYSDFAGNRYTSADALRSNAVDIYNGKDVGQLDWCLLTTMLLNYNSSYAGMPYESFMGDVPTMRDVDKKAREAILGIINSGTSPVEVVVNRAHDIGLKANISLRMEAFYDPQTYPHLNGSVYNNFLDCRQVDIDGNILNNLSYAYPKFREYIKNILVEAASFPNVDGVNLDFCRYPYVFGYESILTDAYKAEYGVDPKTETTSDGIKRWNQFKADIMTAFLKEVREALPGKTISIRVPYNSYFTNGLDIKEWIRQGLLDVLIPACISYEDFFDITPFADMVKGSNVILYGGITSDLEGHDLTKEEEELLKRGVALNLVSKSVSRQQYLLRAHELYNAGAEGLYIFNNWGGNQCLGLIGDRVKVNKWHTFSYTAELVQNSVEVSSPTTDSLVELKVSGKPVEGFIYNKLGYNIVLPYGTASIPEIVAIAADKNAQVEVSNAAQLPGVSTILVTSPGGQSSKTYTVNFTLGNKPEEPQPQPEQKPEQKPVNGVFKSVPVLNSSNTAELSVSANVIADAFAQVSADSKGVRRIGIELQEVIGAKEYSLLLPSDVLSKEDGKTEIEITTPLGKIIAPSDMLANAGLKASNIGICVAPANRDDLSGQIREKIGGRPVLELSVRVDGKASVWNNPEAPVTVSIDYTPTAEELKDPEHITVWYIDDNGRVAAVPSGRYNSATGKVTFTTTHFSKYAVAYVQKTFTDIASYGWAKKQIEVLASKGIINGTSDITYTPGENITRADFVKLLVNGLGLTARANSNFNDVKVKDYYYEAVGIAKELGITSGVGGNCFNPGAPVTRQDMMVMAGNALKIAGKLSVTGDTGSLAAYSDASRIAPYAKASVAVLVKDGIVQGSDNCINPEGNATRAEVAVIIYRIYNK